MIKNSNSNFKKIFSNLSFVALERAFQILFGVVINAMLARYLTQDDFGRWQYAQTLIVIALSCTWVCGNEILVPRLVNAPLQKQDTMVKDFFVIRMIASIVVFLCFIFFTSITINDDNLMILLFCLSPLIILKEPFLVIFGWFQSITYTQPALILNVLGLIFKVFLTLFLIKLQVHLHILGLVLVLEALLIAVGLVFIYRKYMYFQFQLNITRLIDYIKSGFLMWIALLLMYIFIRLDRLLLQNAVNFDVYAIYATAAQINENWLAITNLVSQSLAPILIYKINDPQLLIKNIKKAFLIVLSIVLLGIVTLYSFSPFLFVNIFGEKYIESSHIFRIIIWSAVFQGIDSISNLVIYKYGKMKALILKWIVSLAFFYTFYHILTPSFLSFGTAYSMVFGCLINMIFGLYLISRILKSECSYQS